MLWKCSQAMRATAESLADIREYSLTRILGKFSVFPCEMRHPLPGRLHLTLLRKTFRCLGLSPIVKPSSCRIL